MVLSYCSTDLRSWNDFILGCIQQQIYAAGLLQTMCICVCCPSNSVSDNLGFHTINKLVAKLLCVQCFVSCFPSTVECCELSRSARTVSLTALFAPFTSARYCRTVENGFCRFIPYPCHLTTTGVSNMKNKCFLLTTCSWRWQTFLPVPPPGKRPNNV